MILERRTLPGLIGDINRPWISIIIGARQTGKITLLNEITKKSPSKALYLNLENPFHFDVLRDETEMREYLSEMYQAYIQKDIKQLLLSTFCRRFTIIAAKS